MDEMKEKKKQQLLDLDRLTNIISRIEEGIVQLRKKYERAIQQKNERYTHKFDVIKCVILKFISQQYFSTYEQV